MVGTGEKRHTPAPIDKAIDTVDTRGTCHRQHRYRGPVEVSKGMPPVVVGGDSSPLRIGGISS